MSQEQKIAWLVVGAFAAGVVAFLVLVAVFGKVIPAFGGFGFLGFAGLGPLIFRKKRKVDVVGSDERDRMIAQKATLAGAMMSYGIFLLGCMGTWTFYHRQGQELISIYALPSIAGAGGITYYVARSIAILILYGRAKRNGED